MDSLDRQRAVRCYTRQLVRRQQLAARLDLSWSRRLQLGKPGFRLGRKETAATLHLQIYGTLGRINVRGQNAKKPPIVETPILAKLCPLSGARYGFNTSRRSTQPPRKKRWRTIAWPMRKMVIIKMASKRNFTTPSQGDGRASECFVFESVI